MLDSTIHQNNLIIGSRSDSQKYILTAAKGGSITFVGKIFMYIISFFFSVMVARFLGADQYGLYRLSITITTLTSALCFIGLDGGLTRYVPIALHDQNQDRLWGIIQVCVGVPGFISIILTMIFLFGSETIVNQLFSKPALLPILRITVIAVPFLVISSCLASIAQGFKKLQYEVYSKDLGFNIIKFLFSFMVLTLGFGIVGISIVYVFAAAFSFLLLLYFVHQLFPLSRPLNSSHRNFREIFQFSFPLFLQRLLNRFGRDFETMVLGYFGVFADVGVFAAILRLSNIGNIFFDSLKRISAPVISELYTLNKYVELQKFYQSTTKWAITFNLPIFFTIFMFGKTMLTVFGKDFTVGMTGLVILSGGALFNASTGSCGIVINMTGRTKLGFLNSVIYLLTTIILDFILIPKWNLLGAACAASLTIIINNSLRFIEVYFLINKLLPFNLSFLKPFAAILSASGLTYFLNRLLPSDWMLLKFFILAPVMWMSYISIILLLKLSEEDRMILNKLRRSLKKNKR